MSAELPVRSLESELLRAARPGRRTILCAPTGSGKSTQVPQMLLDGGAAGGREVVVLQPRRIAARLLAARVARERGGAPGGEVGYEVRFERVAGPGTRIRFVTEGLLLRRMLARPGLPEAGVLVFDEFHERHLETDLALALALRLQAGPRPDLGLLIMSATLDPEPLRRYLGEAETLVSAGREHPVRIEYLARAPAGREGPWDAAADAAARLVGEGLEGDLLVFQPGAYEIARTCRALGERPALRGAHILPLHGGLPLAAQEAALRPRAARRVVVATNVAETSLTIEGIRAVIDGGLARVARYDPRRGINALRIERISRASADQRAGRAGRLAPGRCVRLWTERDHAARPLAETPEIRRVDLAEAFLLLKAGGPDGPEKVRWLDPPEPLARDRALALLSGLGALDGEGVLTPLGRRMASIPAHPRLSRMLLTAVEGGAAREAALAAAIVQGPPLRIRRPPGGARDGRERAAAEERAPSDFHPLMRDWSAARSARFDPEQCLRLGLHAPAARQVGVAMAQFLRLARAPGGRPGGGPPPDALNKALLAAFPDHLARRLDGGTLRCEMTHGRRGVLDRASAVRHAPLFVAAEAAEIEGRELQIVLSLAAEVREDWIGELFPGEVRERVRAEWEPAGRRVSARCERVFRGLVLGERPLNPPPPEPAARALAEAVLREDLPLPGWDDRVRQWIERVRFLVRVRPDLGFRDFDEEARAGAVRALCAGASSYREIKDREVLAAVRSVVPADQAREVDRQAPDRILLPGGARGRIRYAAGAPPRLAARIQDLYGLEEAPRIAGNRVVLAVEILGPNFRPLQITTDLRRFWRETYPSLLPGLRRKYPRHEWR